MNLEDIDELITQTRQTINDAQAEIRLATRKVEDGKKVLKNLNELRVYLGGEPLKKREPRKAGGYPRQGTRGRRILDYVGSRPTQGFRAQEIAEAIGDRQDLVANELGQLRLSGLVDRVERGVYRHKPTSGPENFQTDEQAESSFALAQ